MLKTINKFWLVILIVFLIAGWFYWFQVRPAAIQSACGKKTVETLKKDASKRTPEDWQKTYDLIFESCIHDKGFK